MQGYPRKNIDGLHKFNALNKNILFWRTILLWLLVVTAAFQRSHSETPKTSVEIYLSVLIHAWVPPGTK